jgi:TRAP-type C4-dicarboxylate transport system substrate-binding protein
MTAHNSAIIVGGTMMRKDKLDELPPDLREVFDSTAARAHEILNKVIRKDDQKAYDVVLKKGIQPVEAGDAKAEWDAADKMVRDKLTGRMFSKSLVDAVAEAAKP